MRADFAEVAPVGLAQRLSAGPVELAAQALLGAYLSANGVSVRLTEVEAYAGVGEDPASHAHRGRTPRNAVMFGPAGRCYVYFVYGMHWCVNVVCGPTGVAAAVLLRAGEVVEGRALAQARRPGVDSAHDLARGPARLAKCLAVDANHNGAWLFEADSAVRLADAAAAVRCLESGQGGSPVGQSSVLSGPRVGVAGAAERPWRFWLSGERSVSPYRRRNPIPRPTSGTRESSGEPS